MGLQGSRKCADRPGILSAKPSGILWGAWIGLQWACDQWVSCVSRMQAHLGWSIWFNKVLGPNQNCTFPSFKKFYRWPVSFSQVTCLCVVALVVIPQTKFGPEFTDTHTWSGEEGQLNSLSKEGKLLTQPVPGCLHTTGLLSRWSWWRVWRASCMRSG